MQVLAVEYVLSDRFLKYPVTYEENLLTHENGMKTVLLELLKALQIVCLCKVQILSPLST